MKKIAFFILIILIFTNCVKGPRCWGEDKYKGIIVEHIEIDRPIGEFGHKVIIDDDSTYKRAFSGSIDSTLLYELPYIDFSKYTLLGAWLGTGGSRKPKIICEVTDNSEDKTYTFKANLRQCGWGKKYWQEFVWVIVPKIPKDYSIEFDLKDQ